MCVCDLGLDGSLIPVGLSCENRQVPVTYKALSLKGMVMVEGDMSTEFEFMHDNTRLHQANIVSEFLHSEFITPIKWPAFSPGLKPAQHVWHKIGKRNSTLQLPSTCKQKLRRALLAEGSNLSQESAR
ncbi:transposable element Tc3 transposase [Trichonephila clavipes]|nr:transposable element Tc3 transposase [Trichonephila clavipes]